MERPCHAARRHQRRPREERGRSSWKRSSTNSGRASSAPRTASTRCRIARASSRSFRASSSTVSPRQATSCTTRSWDAARRCIEAALAGRTPAGCDINPLSAMLAQPRLVSADAGRGRAQACGARLVACRVLSAESSRCFITRRRCARSAPCANICSRATAADRSTASTGGFAWWRSTG